LGLILKKTRGGRQHSNQGGKGLGLFFPEPEVVSFSYSFITYKLTFILAFEEIGFELGLFFGTAKSYFFL